MRKILVFLPALLLSYQLFAQKEQSPFSKFGTVSKKDLEVSIYPIDSHAHAVVLSHIGETWVEGNSDGWFSLITRIHKVTHILNDNGYDEANVEVRLYGAGDQEAITKFRGTTYNLENGKVVESKISRSALIKDRVDRERTLVKFTMPNVKKGSIIEYTYEVRSDYITYPDPWFFQSTTTPVLWSEYTLGIPQFFQYQLSSRGFRSLDMHETSRKQTTFRVSNNRTAGHTRATDFVAEVLRHRWGMKNVPQLKPEPFTRSIRNHLARMEFQLDSYHPPLERKSVLGSWTDVTKRMLESEHFGKHLSSNNNWMRNELGHVIGSETDALKIARAVYFHVRDEFKTTGDNSLFMSDNLRSIYKARSGSPNELNVLLTAMLRNIGFEATPVMLSTAAHGYAIPAVPLINSMNYIICAVTVDGNEYFLDAGQPNLAFGKLSPYCYNGFAVRITPAAEPLHFSSDSLTEQTTLTLIFSNTNDGYLGKVRKEAGYYASLDLRNKYNSAKEKELREEATRNHGDAFRLSDFKIDGVNDDEKPAITEYGLSLTSDSEDIIYLNPLFGYGIGKNPFVSVERHYPVEFPFQTDEIIRGSMDIPKGYVIDELPKQVMVYLDNQKTSFFEYRITTSENIISYLCRTKIGQTLFLPAQYQVLRDFFNYVVQKQQEQIVFKKAAL